MKKKKNKFLQKLGRQGGNKTLQKYGVDHFKRIRALPRKKAPVEKSPLQ